MVFLHGGPGGQTSRANTVFFNPEVYRVVLFDQRGSGKSTPRAEIRENTSQHLAQDIDKLREHLGIETWHMVFGGSWGSTLGLLYAQTYPDRVKSLVLRGVTALRKFELDHSSRRLTGAARFYPEMYDRYLRFLPEGERADPVAGYYKLLTSKDPEVVKAAAREWNRWDLTLVSLKRSPNAYAKLEDPDWCLVHALMEAHYFAHGGFLERNQLFANIDKIQHIPGMYFTVHAIGRDVRLISNIGAIVQGRYDLITPPKTAWELHEAWPKSSLTFIEDAGHSATVRSGLELNIRQRKKLLTLVQ